MGSGSDLAFQGFDLEKHPEMAIALPPSGTLVSQSTTYVQSGSEEAIAPVADTPKL